MCATLVWRSGGMPLEGSALRLSLGLHVALLLITAAVTEPVEVRTYVRLRPPASGPGASHGQRAVLPLHQRLQLIRARQGCSQVAS